MFEGWTIWHHVGVFAMIHFIIGVPMATLTKEANIFVIFIPVSAFVQMLMSVTILQHSNIPILVLLIADAAYAYHLIIKVMESIQKDRRAEARKKILKEQARQRKREIQRIIDLGKQQRLDPETETKELTCKAYWHGTRERECALHILKNNAWLIGNYTPDSNPKGVYLTDDWEYAANRAGTDGAILKVATHPKARLTTLSSNIKVLEVPGAEPGKLYFPEAIRPIAAYDIDQNKIAERSWEDG